MSLINKAIVPHTATIGVRDQWLGIELALGNELQRFLAVATVNAASLEGQILAVHIRQRQSLRLVVKRHHSDDRIRTSALPRKLKGILCSCHFKHNVCTAVITVLSNKIKALIGRDRQHIGIIFIHKLDTILVLLAHDDALGILQHNAKERADSRGACTDEVGAMNTFELAWQCARPNAIVTVVALYDKAQTLPLPDMYGKNLTFKTGGVDGCDCEETLKLIAEGKLDTEPLITHTYPLSKIDEAYELFENKRDGVIKVAVEC